MGPVWAYNTASYAGYYFALEYRHVRKADLYFWMGVWALVHFKMEFEELKVEIPADDSDKEEKDLPSSFVSKIKIYLADSFFHSLEHLSIFFCVFCSHRKGGTKTSQVVL